MRQDRYRRILELLQQGHRVTVSDVVTMFGVSEVTARRDLRDLDREGLAKRVHGGAVNNLGRGYEPPYQLRSTQNSPAKRAIGKAAAALVSDGDSIALDIGTTTQAIVPALQGRHNLTVVTASLPIAYLVVSHLALESDVRLILTGGVLRSGELSMTGEFASDLYHRLHVDKAFVGVGGLSLKDGLTEYNLDDALIKRALLSSASKIIVVADGSKFGQTKFASVGTLPEVDTVITDETAPPDIIQGLRMAGIEVIVAPADHTDGISDEAVF